MKNYRKLIGIIIAIAIVVIGTSEPAKNIYKARCRFLTICRYYVKIITYAYKENGIT